MIYEKEKLDFNLYTWEEIKKIFFDKNFKNVILFSQPRSGSTFVSNVLSKELNYSENFFPEAICFQVKKRIGLTIDEAIERAKPHMGQMINEFSNTMEISEAGQKYNDELEAEIAGKGDTDPFGPAEKVRQEAEATLANRGLTDPGSIMDHVGGTLKKGFGNTWAAWNTGIAGQKKMTPQGTTANTLGNIYMNMPQNIQFSEASNWDQTSLGWVGAIQNSFGEMGTSAIAGSAGNIGAAALGGTLGALAQTLGIKSAGLVGAGLAALSQGNKIQAGIETKLGVAQNPYMEMMFQGIGFRKFTFNFILRPRNLDEVKQVMGIIKAFRLHSKPDWAGGLLGQGFMKYPMEFHISFLTLENGTARVAKPNKIASKVDKVYNQNTHIPLIKPCVCTNVETNYTPQSIWAAYKGGNPVAITLGLSFNETELVMAKDVDGGY